MINLGYACINMSLSTLKKSERITTNRSMIKRTFQQRGVAYASELALQNIKDLYTILQWNKKHNINFFRLSSNLFPWASEYSFDELPDYENISYWAKKCGDFVRDNNHRITSHPGPFNKLTSPHERVVVNTIKDLEIHGKFFDMLYLPKGLSKGNGNIDLNLNRLNRMILKIKCLHSLIIRPRPT